MIDEITVTRNGVTTTLRAPFRIISVTHGKQTMTREDAKARLVALNLSEATADALLTFAPSVLETAEALHNGQETRLTTILREYERSRKEAT